MKVIHAFDYKSPYAYLAQEETFALDALSGVEVEWQPLTLDIPSFLGAAELGEDGRDQVGTRNAHQWRRVRYVYMDCRRLANARGLTLRGPRRVFDTRTAHVGFLFAQHAGSFRRYHELVFERFWRRELEIEDPSAIASVLGEAGVDPAGFEAFLAGPGGSHHDRLQEEAHARGVFGVPSYEVEGELFWGSERLPLVRERLGVS